MGAGAPGEATRNTEGSKRSPMERSASEALSLAPPRKSKSGDQQAKSWMPAFAFSGMSVDSERAFAPRKWQVPRVGERATQLSRDAGLGRVRLY